MGGLNEMQKLGCLNNLEYESWRICSKCPFVRFIPGFAGSHTVCTLRDTDLRCPECGARCLAATRETDKGRMEVIVCQDRRCRKISQYEKV